MKKLHRSGDGHVGAKNFSPLHHRTHCAFPLRTITSIELGTIKSHKPTQKMKNYLYICNNPWGEIHGSERHFCMKS